MVDRNGADDPNTPIWDLPGSQYLSAVGEVWTRTLSQLTVTYGKAWDQVQAGKFGPGELWKAAGSLWREQYRAVQDLATLPFGTGSPQWHYFHYDKAEGNALADHVVLRARQDATVEIASTPLHGFTPGASLRDAYEATWADDRGALDIRFDADKLKGAAVGEYIGFILNGAAASGPPLLILMLHVS